jgi:hypothetical protein
MGKSKARNPRENYGAHSVFPGATIVMNSHVPAEIEMLANGVTIILLLLPRISCPAATVAHLVREPASHRC